jgi:hypothetical protein
MDAEDILGFVVFLTIVVLLFYIPYEQSNRIEELKIHAVESGAAYYKVDKKGKAEFTWKHLEKAEK